MAFKKRSIWSKLFKKPDKKPNYSLQDILSGIAPIYSNGFGDNVYASDVVQQAIYSIITEIKKLDVIHVRAIGNDYVPVAGNIQNVLDNPNPLMTTSDFIEKIMWNLLLNYNSFVYPIWNGNTLIAMYPLQPTRVEFQEVGDKGKVEINFAFANGTESGWLPYENIIHIRYKYSMSEYMGGNKQGQPDYQPLLDTLNLNDTLLKGLAKSLNLQTTINGIVKFKTMVNEADQLKRIKEFEEKLQSNQSGMLPIDVSSEYIPIQKQVQLLDATTLEFIDKKIIRWWGTSIPIIDGDYTKEQYEAFFQKQEHLIKSLIQAFTKGIFSNREMHGFNNKILFQAKELIFLNTSQKIELFDRLIDSGCCFKNEFRTAFGLKPVAEFNGQIAMSSNLANAENNKVDKNDGGNNE